MRYRVLAVIGGLVVGLGFGCGSSDGDAASGSGAMVGGGSWYVREAWPHDGQPIETENFVVYSDAASAEARQEVATVAEEAWAELVSELAIEPGILRYPAGRDKIDIYAYRDYDPHDWGGRAYHGGLLVWSPDHPRRQSGGNRLSPVVTHELVHVIQWLITGGESRPVDTWFIEGLPLALAGDARFSIRGLDQLDRLTGEYGTVSPISVKAYSQITSPEAGENFYYPMFQLAVEYLMADDGHRASAEAMRDVLIDVAEGASFGVAFESRLGLRVEDFDSEFFTLMEGYLPRYRSPVFAPAGFAAVSTLVIVFLIGALVLGHRHWLATEGGAADLVGPGRQARLGFYGELTGATLVVVVCFLGALFAVGTNDVLYHPAYWPYRLLAYWSLGCYLLGSTVVLLWSVRQWSRRSRSAFLVAPLVVAASGAALFVFILGSALI